MSEQVRAYGGRKTCPGCRRHNEPGAAFCSACGVKLPARATAIAAGTPAGFWVRLAAFAIDALLLLLVRQFLLARLHHRAFDFEELLDLQVLVGMPRGSVSNLELPDALAIFGLDGAYFTAFVAALARTPGKWICGLKVVRGDGGRVAPGFAFMRWLSHFFSLLPCCAGYAWIAISKEKRAFHDLLCDTRVVYAEGPP